MTTFSAELIESYKEEAMFVFHFGLQPSEYRELTFEAREAYMEWLEEHHEAEEKGSRGSSNPKSPSRDGKKEIETSSSKSEITKVLGINRPE